MTTSSGLQELFEKECQMALQDRVQEETSERKNALEAYIYSLRNKLADSLASYVTESEAETTRQRLDAAEVPLWAKFRLAKTALSRSIIPRFCLVVSTGTPMEHTSQASAMPLLALARSKYRLACLFNLGREFSLSPHTACDSFIHANALFPTNLFFSFDMGSAATREALTENV